MVQATAFLVHFYDDEAGKERKDTDMIQDGMDVGAFTFLIGGV